MRKPCISSLFIIAFLAILTHTSALAQDSPDNRRSSPQFDKGWFSFGMGLDHSLNASDDQKIGVSLSANFGRNKFWQVGLDANSTLWGNASLYALKAGRGYSSVGRWTRISLAGGPAFVFGELKNNMTTSKESFRTAGIYTDSQLIFTPIKELGIGIQLLGNVNFQQSYGGLRLILSIEGHK